MKRKLAVLFAAVCAFSLCFALVGCGGGANNAEAAKNFTGTWVVSGGELDGEALDDETIALMESFDMYLYINLNEDGSASFMIFGEELKGDWKVKDASTATLTLEGDSADVKLANDELSFEYGGDKLTFKKGEVPSPSGASTTDTGTTVIDEPEGEEINAVIADDGLCTITVLSSGRDFADDLGYNINVVNNSDAAIFVYSEYGSFSVDGKMMDPYGSATVKPGKNADFFIYFSELESMDDLVNVEGSIVVVDDDTWDELGRYDFIM